MWKNATATALALLITGRAWQTFTVQNKPAAAGPSETTTHCLSFLNWQKKLSMQPKFVAAQKVASKWNPAKTAIDVGFITLGIYTPLEARVLLTYELPTSEAKFVCTAH